jgi:hypothetical protein
MSGRGQKPWALTVRFPLRVRESTSTHRCDWKQDSMAASLCYGCVAPNSAIRDWLKMQQSWPSAISRAVDGSVVTIEGRR